MNNIMEIIVALFFPELVDVFLLLDLHKISKLSKLSSFQMWKL